MRCPNRRTTCTHRAGCGGRWHTPAAAPYAATGVWASGPTGVGLCSLEWVERPGYEAVRPVSCGATVVQPPTCGTTSRKGHAGKGRPATVRRAPPPRASRRQPRPSPTAEGRLAS